MRISPLIGTIAFAILLGCSLPANAHLERPQSDFFSPVHASAKMMVAFPHAIDSTTSKVQIWNAHGIVVETGTLRASRDGSTLYIPLFSPLPPEAYTIRWRVITPTGTVETGGYSFTIDPISKDVPALALQ